MLVPLGGLPILTFVLVAYLVRPRGPAFAPVRLALARAAVLVCGGAAVLVEVLSALDALTTPVLVSTWSVATAAVATGAALRYRRHASDGAGSAASGLVRRRVTDRMRLAWARSGRVERVLLSVLAVQILAELLIAVWSPPNNFDSQTYHLSRIEHWRVQQDVDLYPTSIDRQVAMSPGAEYLLLHLRLLTGGDSWYNLLQFCAGIGCALLASRIAGQLGGSNRAAVLAAFVVASTPMVALESTSTQTDLVVALWVAAVATLVLDELDRRTSARDTALIGTAVGLTVLAKATGALAAVLLVLLWLVAQVRRGVPRGLGAGVLAAVLAAAVSGPYLGRVWAEYGDPRGAPYQRDLISMQRHDPPSVLVNALRIAQSALQTPVAGLNQASATGIERLSRALGVDPNDQLITFWGTRFPVTTWMPDEDKAAFPISGLLVLCGAGVLLVRPRGRPRQSGGPAMRRPMAPECAGRVRGYAGLFWLALLIHVATVKWQPWGNRLLLYLLVLGAPLAGLWLDALLPWGARALDRASDPPMRTTTTPPVDPLRTRPSGLLLAQPAELRHTRPVELRRIRPAHFAGTAVVTLALVASASAGWLAVGYGWPRRLVGQGSIFTETEMQARFQRRPEWLPEYERVAAAVRASGAHRIGLVEGYNSWEYPWWLLLPGDDLFSLRSLQPDLPPPHPESVEAVICVGSARLCGVYTPQGWTMHMRGDFGYALPAGHG